MPGVTFKIRGPAGARQDVVTDDSGIVLLLNLVEGWYSARWQHRQAGSIRLFQDVRVNTGARTTLTVSATVPESGSVSGRVLRRGKGVSGVRLLGAGPWGMAFVKSGRGGRFRFPKLYGNPVKIWPVSDQGFAYTSVETVLGAKGVTLEIEDACRLEITVIEPDLRECRQGPGTVMFRRSPNDAPTWVGLRKVRGSANRFFTEMVPAEATAVCFSGVDLLRSAWQTVALLPGETTTWDVTFGRCQFVSCDFSSPFSGIVILYSFRAGRWVESDRDTIRNEVTRHAFNRSQLSGSAFRVHAFPVSGGERRGEVSDCAESLQILVPVSETGGSRIVVRTDRPDARSVSLFREELSGWKGIGAGAVTRILGTRPCEWTLVSLTGEVGAGRPLVFGGLLPGRYRVSCDSEMPDHGPVLAVGSGESQTVDLE